MAWLPLQVRLIATCLAAPATRPLRVCCELTACTIRWVCRVGERTGGFFTTSWGWHHRGGIGLDTDSRCIRDAANHLQFHHPPIDFLTPDLSTTIVLNADQATLQSIPWIGRTYDLGRGGAFQVGGDLNGWSVTYKDVAIMTSRSGPCTVTQSNQEKHGHAFMIFNGTGYMHGASPCRQLV